MCLLVTEERDSSKADTSKLRVSRFQTTTVRSDHCVTIMLRWRYVVIGLRRTLLHIISIQLILNTTPTSTNVRPDIQARLFNVYSLLQSSSLLTYVLTKAMNIIQIVIGIEVNSESNFPQLREYCPSAEGTRAIFPN